MTDPSVKAFTEEDLKNQLAKMGLRPEDTVLIHSSMKAIGNVEGGAQAVLDALCAYFSEGLLILPTHTWKTVDDQHNVYDPETEPSCVGILTELFRKRPGVIRSLHPTHSVAAFGKRAAEYVKGEENAVTPCPRWGCWGRLIDERAKILFVGCPLTKFTFIHGVEEWAGIPDRISCEPQTLLIKMPDGSLKEISYHRHSSSVGHVSDNYGKLTEPLLMTGIVRKGKIGAADCMIADAARCADYVSSLLSRDPGLFSDPDPISRSII